MRPGRRAQAQNRALVETPAAARAALQRPRGVVDHSGAEPQIDQGPERYGVQGRGAAAGDARRAVAGASCRAQSRPASARAAVFPDGDGKRRRVRQLVRDHGVDAQVADQVDATATGRFVAPVQVEEFAAAQHAVRLGAQQRADGVDQHRRQADAAAAPQGGQRATAADAQSTSGKTRFFTFSIVV